MSEVQGCTSARHYGNSYIILKPEIKARITFTHGDSSWDISSQSICTFGNFAQLFLHLKQKTLIDIVNLIKYNKGILKQRPIISPYTYIEIQIHGDLDIKRDCEHIMLYYLDSSTNIIDRLNKDKIPYTIFK